MEIIVSFFNFLRNFGRFFRSLQKIFDYLWKLQNEKFNIRRKAEKLQISEKLKKSLSFSLDISYFLQIRWDWDLTGLKSHIFREEILF